MPKQFFNSRNWNQSLSLNAGFGVLSWRRGCRGCIFILPHLESFFSAGIDQKPWYPKKIWIRHGHLNYNITFVQNNVTEVSIHLTSCCDQISLANFPHLVTKWTIVLHQICYTKYYEKYSQIKIDKKPKKYWCDNLLIIVEPGTTCNETTTNENLVLLGQYSVAILTQLHPVPLTTSNFIHSGTLTLIYKLFKHWCQSEVFFS